MSKVVGSHIEDHEGIVTHIKVNDKWYSIENYFNGNGFSKYKHASPRVRALFVLRATMDFYELEKSRIKAAKETTV